MNLGAFAETMLPNIMDEPGMKIFVGVPLNPCLMVGEKTAGLFMRMAANGEFSLKPTASASVGATFNQFTRQATKIYPDFLYQWERSGYRHESDPRAKALLQAYTYNASRWWNKFCRNADFLKNVITPDGRPIMNLF